MKIIPYCSCILVVAILMSCTAGITNLPPSEIADVRRKVDASLAPNERVKSMFVLQPDWTNNETARTLAITLIANPANEEMTCRKVIRSLSRGPSLSSVDAVCLIVEQNRSVRMSAQFGRAAARGALLGLAGAPYTHADLSREDVMTFRCRITKDALLKGKDPKVEIRNGIYVSGPYEGQGTDSLWLHEKTPPPAGTDKSKALH